MTQDPIEKAKDWQKIAYDLFSIIDDIDLYFQSQLNGMEGKVDMFSPYNQFMVKKFIEAQKYFRRYKNRVLTIEEYEEQKKRDEDMTNKLMTAFTRQGPAKPPL